MIKNLKGTAIVLGVNEFKSKKGNDVVTLSLLDTEKNRVVNLFYFGDKSLLSVIVPLQEYTLTFSTGLYNNNLQLSVTNIE